ncbi:MAG TPA: DEAD/DEAH box helicase family protein [Bacteroidota bacterium]|nr:DEAD/DEAH box helicase family protein [Bacteroidota bacterium]
MKAQATENHYHRSVDLALARQLTSHMNPAAHQADALRVLATWYHSEQQEKGGLLVLPTGGGKTFTSWRFLITGPLSDGYKILWLAHTHHLLDQAYHSVIPQSEELAALRGYELGLLREPRSRLDVRVVSGSAGFFPPHQISEKDDVIIGTLQTLAAAVEDAKLRGMQGFLDSADGKLLVVFDEAHHAPAPTFRRMMMYLRERIPSAIFLGLTATPTYSDEGKLGWLKRIFPQGIVYQAEHEKLTAAGVLSRPVFQEASTNFAPEFDEREFRMWVNTYRDLPEDIVSQLAGSRERNAAIVETYVKNRATYGKTIMFADRWYQCDSLREMLRKRGVKADVVYSHREARIADPEARNARNATDNARILAEFRNGQLDVLINVRMLTEGTDVPNVQTVFLTRQTTSPILLTQMIGRALRGPKFGGTERAYIVSFIDNWKQAIAWAGFDQLDSVAVDDDRAAARNHVPLQWISIELVRRLARMLDEGITISPVAYRSMMPVGWYRCDYLSTVNGDDEVIASRQLVMVMEDDMESYRRCIADMMESRKEGDAREHLPISRLDSRLSTLEKRHFPDAGESIGGTVKPGLYHILRHIGQLGSAPEFFTFEHRDDHDLDALAEDFSFRKGLNVWELDQSLRAEYNRSSRLWNVFYYNYEMFKTQYDACVNRILLRKHQRNEFPSIEVVAKRSSVVKPKEPSLELKEQVKRRDGYRCLCCGESAKRALEIDHIAPAYYGGENSIENLQTLCGDCNRWKATNELNFTAHSTDLLEAPAEFPIFAAPDNTRDADEWERFLRKSLNVFYKCGAVELVHIGKRGDGYYNWEVTLYSGNAPAWLRPHGKDLLQRVNRSRVESSVPPIRSITVHAPDQRSVALKAR